jgi:hypothetical protein
MSVDNVLGMNHRALKLVDKPLVEGRPDGVQ